MNSLQKEKRSLTPEQIIKDFNKKGIKLSIKDAEKYLDMLYLLAKLIVEKNFL
jgi:hypothetical protein